MISFLLDPFSRKAKALLVSFLKKEAGEFWKAKWSIVATAWDSIRAQMRGFLFNAIEKFFSDTWLWKLDKDRFGNDRGQWFNAYSIPLDYLREKVEQQVYKDTVGIDEFKAAGIGQVEIRDLTRLYLDLFFEKTLRTEMLGRKIGSSDYILLDIIGEAYRVDSNDPAWHVLLKVGRVSSSQKIRDVLVAWKERNKLTPPRYERGQFVRSKLEAPH
jgi:hypothetical protein